ncbi:MAG TPA: HTH domain-containing protein [Polyangiaceae bacterium]
MTFTEAAAQVLRLVGKPLHYKEITDVAIEKNLLSHVGKSPEVTMGARLAALVKKGEKDNPLVRVKPGVFALREWDDATVEKGLQDRTPALERLAAQHPSEPEDGELEHSSPSASGAGESEAPPPALDDAERERAEFAAHATDFFESEDDDDEPIFGRETPEPAVAEGGERAADGSRRRRRRRRRGRGAGEELGGGDGLPTYTVSDAPVDFPAGGGEEEPRAAVEPRVALEPRVPVEPRGQGERAYSEGSQRQNFDRGNDRGNERANDRGNDRANDRGKDRGNERANDRVNDRGNDRANGDHSGAAFEELTGRGFADGLASLLQTFDRNRGPVSAQTLVDAAQRRGRFFGEHSIGQGTLVAAARADNTRALSRGERPRFRVQNGRIGLFDWALDGELVRLESEIQRLAERYRDTARRAVLRLLQDLPQRSLGELIVLLLEHAGFSDLVPVRRQGAHGAELHLSGRLQTPAGEIRTAVVVRRDGREIGRERVTELRGALHHYGPAHAAWLITTGQVLSGAREEAASPGASPLTVIDGIGLVRLCEEHRVGVARAEVPLLLPDLDLLDGLRVS